MISRQRKWQIKQRKRRKCITCGKQAITAQYCETHRDSHNLHRVRKYYPQKAYGEFADVHNLIMQIQSVCKEKINAKI